MPDSLPDIQTSCQVYERKLRGLKRNILGITNAGKEALSDSSKIPIFKAKLACAQADWEQYQRVWDERDSIQVHVEHPGSWPDETWYADYDRVRDELCEAAAIHIQLDENQARIKLEITANQSRSDPTSVGTSLAELHLPKINIPSYSGDLRHWISFKDTFMSMVHNVPTLSNIKKFHHLRSALKGDAAMLISRIPVGEDSYNQAWAKLMKAYDNPRILASLYVQRILDCDTKSCKSDLQRYEAFLNNVADGIEGFRALLIADKMDFLLSYLALRALDVKTRNEIEMSLTSQDTAHTADMVIEFVRRRMSAIKMSRDSFCSGSSPTFMNSDVSASFRRPKFPDNSSRKYNPIALHITGSRRSTKNSSFKNSPGLNATPDSSPTHPVRLTSHCPLCKGVHSLSKCREFFNLPVDRRVGFVNGWKGCRNCLYESHKVSDCPSRWNCRKCNKRHHSLLHQPAGPVNDATRTEQEHSNAADSFNAFGSSVNGTPPQNMVLLGTAQCFIKDRNDGLHLARAVIDSGSQQTFMSKSLAQRLGYPIEAYEGQIMGLGGVAVVKPVGSITSTINAFRGSAEIVTTAVVVDQIGPSLPAYKLPEQTVKKMARLELADRSFDTPGTIDLLIGADIYFKVVNGAPYSSPVPELFLLPTVLDLVVMGKLTNQPSNETVALFTQPNDAIEKQLKLFWEMEEPINVNRSHPDDLQCEDHFKATYTRTQGGRYMVRLPFKCIPTPHRENRDLATRRFLNLERRLIGNPTLQQMYLSFMNEYRDLGHMTVAERPGDYFIPHHGIWQGSKLRVVFDASCPSSNGTSLNDALFSGPKLQQDICLVLARFRLYAVPLCADLVKMYRQILIHPEDRLHQQILWRENPDAPLMVWDLNTVTYGVRSSPYQALKVIKQHILDEGANFPLAADRASKDMLVDDIVSGADTVDEAHVLKQELCDFFAKGGFALSKWASTERSLLPSGGEKILEVIPIKQGEESLGSVIKILGLVWNTKSDSFSYSIKTPLQPRLTKRVVLSAVARIFDPLGFLSPVILLAKILLQETWKAKLDWDDPLPPKLIHQWNDVFDEWPSLSSISIPRYITSIGALHVLIGLCDASTKGYAAAVYLRSEGPNRNVKVSLIKAKTKVAPVKYVSIARLELCSALLLARLLSSVVDGIPHTGFRCFTDSNTVLAWLRLPAYNPKVFEANRVSQILTSTPLESWSHVRSEENPCDIGSRGCSPSGIRESKLWWHGPHWLQMPISSWPESKPPIVVNLLADTAGKAQDNPSDGWTSRFSSYLSLVRTTARILRWKDARKSVGLRLSRSLDTSDLNNAKTQLIRTVQRTHLPANLFSSGSPTPAEFQQLSPFLDRHGIVRVGGRLQNAPVRYSTKHPILIPSRSHFAKLIIRDAHERHFHAGQSLVLAILRNSYWIPQASKAIRACILRCVHCRKVKAKPMTPMMAPLPKDRFAQSRTFMQVGVDYAGPFCIKESSRRNASQGKAYLCLFVCLVTKALHLETVTSLSTVSFLAAFERFTSRRGLPKIMRSDNATNFVGASRFLKDVYAFLSREKCRFTDALSPLGVEWKFIPPRAPHFGGIWEAGVKSVKSLLISTMGKQPYTYEELSTAFTRIEAILNSRPLCALTDDPENFDFLTPGHFIIGAPLLSLPESSATEAPRSALTRWELMKTQIATVWDRWRKEYLHSLQLRRKWNTNTPNLQVGDLVVLLEKRFVVGEWPVVRIVETFPGRDGVTRTVVVRTQSGTTLTRAATSLIRLFYDDSDGPNR